MADVSIAVAKLEENLGTWLAMVKECDSLEKIDVVRRTLLGKSSPLITALGQLKELDASDKRSYGDRINKVKNSLEAAITDVQSEVEELLVQEKLQGETVDITLPFGSGRFGSMHIITQAMRRIKQYYQSRGFSVIDGPEIETSFFNFDALNTPQHHPARQSHDTFYIDGFEDVLLRTQTSCVQVHAMLNDGIPIRMVSMGKTYRRDATDTTHSPMFHQLEGLVVDRTPLSIGHLKSELVKFISYFFGVNDVAVRFRPSFFPFVEPGMEFDCRYSKKDGKVVFSQSGDRWLEIGGAGMVHPNVFKSCGITEEVYGFAYAFGIERIIMLRDGISDIRNLYSTDRRLLRHYGLPS